MAKSSVNILRLKQFAAERLGHRSALREVLLQEKDEVAPVEFLAKLQVWLALLRHKEEGAE